MAWEHNTEIIVKILEEAGFDTIISQTVNGIREDGETNHQVFINPKGRIRYQYSRQLDHFTDSITLIGREFDLDKENRDIVNIMGELENYDELVKFLQSIPDMLRKEVRK